MMCLCLTLSCSVPKTQETSTSKDSQQSSNQVRMSDFQQAIDTSGLLGGVLIYDLAADTFYSNDFAWAAKRHLPASTFKIPNSMIMLESKTVASDSALIPWHGDQRMFPSWEQEMTLKQAFHRSCLPCYQQLTRRLGFRNMQSYTSKLNYGTLQYDSTEYDRFWVEGSSGISQLEQIDFLTRLYNEKLPFSKRTYELTKRIIKSQSNEYYQLSAKTGWSIIGEKHNGWYVGYVKAKGKIYFFATNLTPTKDYDMSLFSKSRKKLTFMAFQELKIADKGWEEFK
ncbi:MAG: penicillin-binding transpeptidase domain-containing protein [Bacteroidota bacterium]